MAAKATTPLKSKDLPIEERIRQRAHEIYLQRGGQDGSDMEDWFQAEDELRQAEEGSFVTRGATESHIEDE